MCKFDRYPDDSSEYLTNLFVKNDLEAIERLVGERGESFLDQWKETNEAIVRQWLTSLDTSEVRLLKAINEYPNVFSLERRWRLARHRQFQPRENRHEDISAENLYYIDMSETKGGDKITIVGGISGGQNQFGGSGNTAIIMPSITASMIREKLEAQGLSKGQIASIGQEITEIAAECDKEAVNKGKLQGIISKIKEKAGSVAFDLISKVIAGLITAK